MDRHYTPQIMAMLACVGLASCGPSPTEKAKELASYDLFDPTSAQFRGLNEVGKNCVSGEINAKNKMGAYIGFRPFLVDVETRHVAIAGDGEDLDATLANARLGLLKDQCGIKE